MRRLGQHFLASPAIIRNIVRALDPQAGETIIEIGPGHGELTGEIKNGIEKIKGGGQKIPHIIAIEKDSALVCELKKLFRENPKIEIIEGDALEVLPALIKNLKDPYKIIGNIPYYLTGKLLRVLSELKNPPKLIVLTIQKEVAERLVAKPPNMNRLAAITAYWADANILGFISKSEFYPAPEVDSALITLVPRKIPTKAKEGYFKTAKALFAQPRKTVLNNLTAAAPLFRLKTKGEISDALNKLKISPSDRPQRLDIATIEKLSRLLSVS